jgi:trehalose 6-phosphate phosphatase
MRPSPLDDRDALFLDFDGTLAELVDDPDTAQLAPGQDRVLNRLSSRLGGAVCIISGRALDDLAARSPATLWRAGGHGIDRAAPGEGVGHRQTTDAGLLALIEPIAAAFPAARVEPKGPVVAVHYRSDPGIGPELGAALADALVAVSEYRLHAGKMVWEVKPEGRDKGVALRALMRMPPFLGRRPVMVGDDVTDEDGFAAALALGGLAVKVGEGETLAPHRLPDVAAVWDWLDLPDPKARVGTGPGAF